MENRGEFWIEDGAIASAYILLAVEQYDVGACWVHIRNRTGKLSIRARFILRGTDYDHS